MILGTEHGVIEQGTDIADEPVFLYNCTNTTVIRGIAIHISKRLIFISDSHGSVMKMPLSRNNRNKITYLLPPFQDFMPLDLSIDWLNNQLYILGEVNDRMWQIARCDLDGRGLTIAVAGLRTKPYSIEVDPYNG